MVKRNEERPAIIILNLWPMISLIAWNYIYIHLGTIHLMSVQSILFVYTLLPTQKHTMKMLLLNLFYVCLEHCQKKSHLAVTKVSTHTRQID